MRTIVDLPEPNVQELDAHAKALGISRTEAVRRSVALYLQTLQTAAPAAAEPDVFGLWADRTDIGDGLDYERNMRREWERG